MTGSGVLLAVVCALAGGVAGGGARLLLGRLRRGVAVRVGCCEVLLGGLWAVAGLAWASGSLSGRLLPVLLGLAWLGVAAGAVDVLRRRLPDALTVPAIPAGLLLLVPIGPAAVARGVAGAAVGLSAYGVLHLLRPASLGAGDVKLAGGHLFADRTEVAGEVRVRHRSRLSHGLLVRHGQPKHCYALPL